MKLCYITTNRSDYNYLFQLAKESKKNSNIKNELIISGSHFSKNFGFTYKDIDNKLFQKISSIKYILKKTTNNEIMKLNSKIDLKIVSVLKKNNPSAVILIGDRFELIPFASAALLSKIPIIHIGGGDVSLGSIDNKVRNMISCCANLHFVSSNFSKKRLINIGIKKNKIFNVGLLSLENIKKFKFATKKYLENKYKFIFYKKNYLVSLHPETNEDFKIIDFKNLLDLFKKYENIQFIFTSPSSDTNGDKLQKLIIETVKKNKNLKYIHSFGQNDYFSILKNCDGIIGNSSSAIVEAPSFNIPSLNLGKRQNGRLKSKSTFDSIFDKEILDKNLLKFINLNKLKNVINPYYKKDVSKKIIKNILKEFSH